jgi:hypothetical protein
MDRATMNRTPRPSYELFKEIATAPGGPAVLARHRADAWARLQAHAQKRAFRPFCRSADGKTGLGSPGRRRFSKRDWRYGHRQDLGRDRKAELKLQEALVSDTWLNMTTSLKTNWAEASSALDRTLSESQQALVDGFGELGEAVRAGLTSANAAIAEMRAKAEADTDDVVTRAQLAAAEWMHTVQREVDARHRRDRAWFRSLGRSLRAAWRSLTTRTGEAVAAAGAKLRPGTADREL